MALSILIAKITSIVYLSVALGAVFSKDYYRRIIEDMTRNAALTYFMGFTAVILGSLIVDVHNTWTRDWTVLITIVGWLALVKGVLLIAFPKFVLGYSRPFIEGQGFKFFPYLAVFMGLLFGYFGFVY